MKRTIFLFILCAIGQELFSQQIPDTSYNPDIQNPAYQTGQGSLIFIDEGHHNFHTKNGRYMPFSRLLEKDGYVVEAYKGKFDSKKLARGKILVIANALPGNHTHRPLTYSGEISFYKIQGINLDVRCM